MTATERLRAMLDELRKLACDINEEEIRSHSVITLNHGRYNRQFRLDMNHDWLNAWHTEFERILRAIAATLGPGTCRDVSRTHGRWTCSECGRSMAVALTDEPPKFCPECGRKVEP